MKWVPQIEKTVVYGIAAGIILYIIATTTIICKLAKKRNMTAINK